MNLTRNEHLQRIEQLDRQIEWLRKTLGKGDFLAAGLSIGITVGVPNEDEPDLTVDVGLHCDTELVLTTLLQGLKASREWRIKAAQKDLEDLQKALAQLQKSA